MSWSPTTGQLSTPSIATQELSRYEIRKAESGASEQLKNIGFLTLGLTIFAALLWGTSSLVLYWHGPSLDGAKLVAAEVEALYPDDAALLRSDGIHTLTELTTFVKRLRADAFEADLRRWRDIAIAFVIGIGLLLIIKETKRWHDERPKSVSWTSPVGVLDAEYGFVPSALPIPVLIRVALTARRRVSTIQLPTPLTPMARALLECYIAQPDWPAASEGQHGDTTLLQHVLGVRTRALELADQDGLPQYLAELVAFAHDLGKLVTFRRDTTGWTRISPFHDRMGAMLLVSLPEWQTLEEDDRADITLVTAFHHHPDNIPKITSLRARSLLRLLRLADGLTTEEEGQVDTTTSPQEATQPEGTTTPTTDTSEVEPPADALVDRVARALDDLLPVLRINTRPFDGRADPDARILMLLDQGLRNALVHQLPHQDCYRLGLNGAPGSPTEASTVEQPFPHPSTETIAAAFRKLGYLRESWQERKGVLWDIKIGRRRWRGCWLLNTDKLPSSLLIKWGHSNWPVDITGPSWPLEANSEASSTNDVAQAATSTLGVVPEISPTVLAPIDSGAPLHGEPTQPVEGPVPHIAIAIAQEDPHG